MHHNYEVSIETVIKKGKLGRLNKLTVLLVSLTIQRSSKVNISDKTIEYSTSKIVYITRSTMKLLQKNTK